MRGMFTDGVGQEGYGGREGNVSAFHSLSVEIQRTPLHTASLHMILGRAAGVRGTRGRTSWGGFMGLIDR